MEEKDDADLEAHERRKRSMGLLPSIPIDQQVGPVTFSRDNSKMFITEISYDNKGRIEIKKDGITFYKTKIKFAEYNPKRRGWSSLKPAFPQIKEASYAHPFLFNNDRSLLFSSDLPGGYGGFDLYVCHWDNKTESWGKPINLGSQINTEGDEIYPFIYDDVLSFSSNGHVGYGGFDIYSVIYEHGEILPGSMVHWGSPINTIYNDYGLCPLDYMEGYFISDRGRTKDDVYSYRRGGVSIEDNPLYGMNETDAIAMGAIGILSMDTRAGRTTQKVDLSKFVEIPQEVITVYFDFDRSSLDARAVNTLNDFINNYDFSDIESLYIVGYADEMGGGQGYNEKLSAQRAESVANYLLKNRISVPFEIVDKGQIRLSEEEIREALEQLVWSSNDTSIINNVPYENTPEALRRNVSQDKQIQINRKARRVEIRATFK
ncbi:MAG: OmpA family protein [Odoribacter sp.]|nr:OmpA family protein [Odoribacter sp.]